MAQRPLREKLADIVDPGHTALIVIDVQKDLSPPKYDPTIGRIQRLLAEARKRGIFIVYIQNSVIPNLSNSPAEISRRRKLGLNVDVTIAGSDGERFVDAIAPQAGDVVVRKHRLNAFEGTNLEMLLRNRGIETVLITGVATHGCVTGTSYAAQGLNYYVVVVEDCVDSWKQDLHDSAMHVLRNTMNHVVTVDSLVATWNEARQPAAA